MEVHHHHHESHEHKKWHHYIWEFLMLFLAVFAGFIAENIREDYVEHRREKQYVHSLIADIKTDTAQLNSLVKSLGRKTLLYDSLRFLLKSEDPFQKTNLLYYYFLPTTFYNLFVPMKRTIDQLENSGGLRLIKNMQASDSISEYYRSVKTTESQAATWLRYFDQYHEIAFRVFDYSQIDTVFYDRKKILTSPAHYTLLTNDKSAIKILFNKLFALRFILQSYIGFLEELQEQGTATIQFLQATYSEK